ncbi:IclR family transcriptional regulator [Georgenia sp. Z1491]|uniref:IclR family transcriptional regulator n=1 Tax=Georgenia sp. Z1491 TaxID=3416707 RepID=UPI003CEDB61D
MPRTNEPGAGVLERAVRILDAFDADHLTLGLGELVARSGLAHATTSRIATDLVRARLLARGPDGRYAIGARTRDLALLVPSSASVRAVALPYMHDLHAALREHVQLAVLGTREAVIVDRISAPEAVVVVSDVGGDLPLHASAAGKVLLAHAPTVLVEEVLAGPLERLTPRTVTEPERLRAELARCRRTGLAVVREEVNERASSVAARVVDGTGEVVAAVSVVVRAGTPALRTSVPAVATTALAISRRLGWAGVVAGLDG